MWICINVTKGELFLFAVRNTKSLRTMLLVVLKFDFRPSS